MHARLSACVHVRACFSACVRERVCMRMCTLRAHLGHVEARAGVHGVRRVPRGVTDGELGKRCAGACVEHGKLRAEQMALGMAAGEQRCERLRQPRGGRVGGTA